MVLKSEVTEGSLKSKYLDYLPALYREDEFMGSFLCIFESILNPLENTVDNLSLYFDPLMIPESLLSWLASWFDLVLDPSWPLHKRRELVKSCAELYRWRGTKHGLSQYLRIYTGSEPYISEYVPGMSLNSDVKLGVDTKLGSPETGFHFVVSLYIDKDADIDEDTIHAIIRSQKPAHADYTVRVHYG